MSEKRTKADKAQREADLLDKKSSHRPPQNQGKKPREDFNQAAVRIVEPVLAAANARHESGLLQPERRTQARSDARGRLAARAPHDVRGDGCVETLELDIDLIGRKSMLLEERFRPPIGLFA